MSLPPSGNRPLFKDFHPDEVRDWHGRWSLPSEVFDPHPDVKKPVAAALASIDSVLRLPSREGGPAIPIRPIRSRARHGRHQPRGGALGQAAIEVGVGSKDVHPALTTIHEIGHYIDTLHTLRSSDMGDAGDHQTAEKLRTQRELMGAISDSYAANLLREQRHGFEPILVPWDYSRPTERVHPVTASQGSRWQKRVDYLLKPKEMYARAFTQYIASRSTDPMVRREFAEERKQVIDLGLFNPTYWEDDDFAPIAAAFDKMFAARGMLVVTKAFDPAEPRDDHGRWALEAIAHALGGTIGGGDGVAGSGTTIHLPSPERARLERQRAKLIAGLRRQGKKLSSGALRAVADSIRSVDEKLGAVNDNAVKIYVTAGKGHVTLKDVNVKDKGHGVGMKVIDALVKHADERGVPLLLDDVQNRKFGDRIVRDVPGFFYSGPELYRYPGGVEKAFDPDQPRGPDGKWIRLAGEIKDYLEMSAKIRGAPPEGMRYNSWEDFVLKHGRAYKPGGVLASQERGAMKECYMNATQVALGWKGGGKKYTYVEGFAQTGTFPIPLSHAWVVDDAGTVYDPTWDDGIAYFGVPFTNNELTESLQRTQVWGMFTHLNGEKLLGK